ncbi:PhnB protein [Kineosphaera limosa]|uniref:VOC domain-containing protein n=1 Tax=Kineosphaera limosa NBRC 100340 TaxID=1184609 RepID=K6XCG2_9MICO|nr:VOC family protein [Kineosphaera limosa]NYD99141.1 PhnB protein [Kineosphaera limosa]GAB96499.1 hypothetical protein KILIM_040_00090 [Kineosphaera limosa NBRC 100340]
MTNETPPRPADGRHTTDGTPHGYTRLTPFLVVPRATDAIAFYEQVFGARVLGVTEMGGVVVHAELDFGNGRLQLGEPNPDYGLVPPPGSLTGADDVCYSLAIYVPDVDAVVAAAEAAGAQVREPVVTFVSGDRFGSILDPFGVRWSVMTRVEDLSEHESEARVREWAAQQA